jgi:carbonic anhydrase
MRTDEKLLLNNKSWAQEQHAIDPTFFKRLARTQQPEVLWIGCSDSRVPANQITGTDPGEIFVHRNIANIVHEGDVNAGSVLRYAVMVLKVKHIVVCGHEACGGVRRSMEDRDDLGEIDVWLKRLRKVYAAHKDELASLDEKARENRLCELNVLDNVRAIARLPVIREAVASGHQLTLHGWVYALSDGLLKTVVKTTPEEAAASL